MDLGEDKDRVIEQLLEEGLNRRRGELVKKLCKERERERERERKRC